MTDEQITALLAAIEQREQATTKGPWLEGVLYWTNIYGPNDQHVCTTQGSANATANSAFIAHARADIPTLVALVRQLMEKIAELERDRFDEWADRQ